MKNRFELQDDCTMEDFKMLHPKLLIMLGTVLSFADKRDLPVKVTSIISDRVNVIEKTKTHKEGRAIDISVKGWKENDIKDLQKLMLLLHKDISAISARTKKPRPVVFHNYKNQGDHLHIQCRR